MDNDTEPTRVIPVIGYASPKTHQPAGSLFSVEEHADGILLSKPIQHSRVVGNLSATFVLTAGIAFLYRVETHAARAFEGDSFPFALTLCFMGLAIFVAVAWKARRKVLLIELRAARLTVTNMPGWPLRRWVMKKPLGFKISSREMTNFGRITCNLAVTDRFGFEWQVRTDSSVDECLWLAGVLNNRL